MGGSKWCVGSFILRAHGYPGVRTLRTFQLSCALLTRAGFGSGERGHAACPSRSDNVTKSTAAPLHHDGIIGGEALTLLLPFAFLVTCSRVNQTQLLYLGDGPHPEAGACLADLSQAMREFFSSLSVFVNETLFRRSRQPFVQQQELLKRRVGSGETELARVTTLKDVCFSVGSSRTSMASMPGLRWVLLLPSGLRGW